MRKKTSFPKVVSNKIVRFFLIIVGTLFLFLGVIGIILPLLPTTPFLLLAAACYAKSSKRFYRWLLNNRLFGKTIKNYYEGKGVSVKFKIFTISLLWITIGITIFLIINILWLKLLLFVIATGVTIHIIFIKSKSS